MNAWDGTAEDKRRFHEEGARVLRDVARCLGLRRGQYDLRSTRGGVAVCGEVTLLTDSLYLQVTTRGMSLEGRLWARRVSGREDYTGGENVYLDWYLLCHAPSLVSVLRTEGLA